MKTLKFAPQLVPLILSGEKTVTWRLFDDKDLKVGDEVQFFHAERGDYFATAILTEVKEKTFGELTEEDKRGHETLNDEEMLDTYSSYYNTSVTLETPLKIVRFRWIYT